MDGSNFKDSIKESNIDKNSS